MKILTNSLLLCFVIVTVSGKALEVRSNDGVTVQSGSRIVGGSPADIRQFPWQAVVYIVSHDNLLLFGGASLISSTRLLTAAHNWFDGVNFSTKMTVNLGTNSIDSGFGIVASDVIIHEGYDVAALVNDIAMVYLPYPVEFNEYIQPVALPFGAEVGEDFAGADAAATGYGITDNGAMGDLNSVDLKVLTNQECMQEWGTFGSYVTPKHVCTSGKGIKGVCYGDSGGPLVVYRDDKAILIGITSFRSFQCDDGVPDVYTRVTSFKTWIENHL